MKTFDEAAINAAVNVAIEVGNRHRGVGYSLAKSRTGRDKAKAASAAADEIAAKIQSLAKREPVRDSVPEAKDA